jgi:hypothetical protein
MVAVTGRWQESLAGTHKRCTGCMLVKPLDHFHLKSTKTSTLRSQCKECISKSRRAYYALHGKKVERPTLDELRASREEIAPDDVPAGPVGCEPVPGRSRQPEPLPRKPREVKPVSSKQCSRCGHVKFAREFPVRSKRSDGLHSQCRACHRWTKRQMLERKRRREVEALQAMARAEPVVPIEAAARLQRKREQVRVTPVAYPLRGPKA